MIGILAFALAGVITGLLFAALHEIPHVLRRKRTISRLMMMSRIGC